jgi:hypothetical protein
MIIRKKPARPHGLNEPFRHENHPRPVTRRQLLGAGFLTGPALVVAPAWLGALLKSQRADALDPDIVPLKTECNIAGTAGTSVPFITIDLAGGANLVGSEVLVGVSGGQMNFLSTAGYGRLGLPGNMVPTTASFVNTSLGLAFHSDGAILRGILSKASAATQAGVNGAVIPAMSQNDTGNNPLNAMYGIAKAAKGVDGKGVFGTLLTLCGTQSSVSGGNSAAPAIYIDPTLQPTKIASATDDTGLAGSTTTVSADTIEALQTQARISAGTTPLAVTDGQFGPLAVIPAGGTLGATADATAAAALKEQVRCAYVKNANTAETASPALLNPDTDTNIKAIFTPAEYTDSDFKKTAAVMKLVVNGFAGAGTITIGGYDYHDSTRATGEQRNFKAGVVIGAILEYAQRVGSSVMIQVISDGSLNSTGMADMSVNGRGKLGWQGDSQQTAASFFLVYSPKGRPALRNGAASQQIGFFNSDGTVNATSSPAANANNLLVQTIMLNWMALNGTEGNWEAIFPMQGLGASTARAPLMAFTKIT